jgi:hypothetical protein
MFNLLNDDGVVLVNIISAIEGEKGAFLRAEYSTFKSIFPQVLLFVVNNLNDTTEAQNIMLVALKSRLAPKLTNPDPLLNGYLGHLWTQRVEEDVPILTDDYAPVDNYILRIVRDL